MKCCKYCGVYSYPNKFCKNCSELISKIKRLTKSGIEKLHELLHELYNSK